MYSFYKSSPKRQAALAKEAINTQERRQLDREAKCKSAIEDLVKELDKEVEQGKVLTC